MALFGRKKEEKKAEAKAVEPAAAKEEAKKPAMKDLYREEGKSVAAAKAAGKKEVKKSSVAGKAYRILVKPLITEKASALGADNKYFFMVAKSANKIEVAEAIKEVYGIKPLSVNVINTKGKNIRSGRITGKRKDWKKAVVTLPAGKTIKIYEGV